MDSAANSFDKPPGGARRLALRPAAALMRAVAVLGLIAILYSVLAFMLALPVWVGALLLAVALGVVLVDAVRGLSQRREMLTSLTVLRRMPHALALGVSNEIHLDFTNAGDHPVSLDVFDFVPPELRSEGLPQRLTISSKQKISLHYRVTPILRGYALFAKVEALVDSPLGLWQVRLALGSLERISVYPNFAAVAKFALLATDHRLSRLGIRLKRRRGEGMEFHQLREYRQGDSLRQIDWKATTRQRKLISREYQDERDQRIVFLLDCSRRMRAQDGELSHFDQALNSMMLLTHVALKQGDSVGALSFGGVERSFAPAKGATTLNALTNVFFDIQPQNHTGDYLRAAERLMREIPKRAMVVILTNLRDEDDDELALAVKLLGRKHLVLLASLREQVLREMADRPVATLDDAISVCAAHLYIEQREQAFRNLAVRGTVALDVEPQKLPIALVNSYLEIKRSGRL